MSPREHENGLLRAQEGIAHHARECERCLTLADAVERDSLLEQGVAGSLRKVAAIHAQDAWNWVPTLHFYGVGR